MSTLRISEKHFFRNACRTKTVDTSTDREQAHCEHAVEQLFRDFLNGQASFGLK
jgi:hypothetical protein